MMNDPGKSDKSVVPAKPSNKASAASAAEAAEMVEGRDLAKGNLPFWPIFSCTTCLICGPRPGARRASATHLVVGFESQKDAHRFRQDLEDRLKKFGLELHPEKTRVIEFGPWAARNRTRRKQSKPETFNFLGFTHICGTKYGNGMFTIHRKTMRKRMTSKFRDLKDEMRFRMCFPVAEQGKWLRSVLLGIDRYYGVPGNQRALFEYRREIGWRWWRTLRRRGNKRKLTLAQMRILTDMWFPAIQIHHPYPLERMGVTKPKARAGCVSSASPDPRRG